MIHMDKQKALDYLFVYQDFRYYYILHSMEKLIDNYYSKEGSKEVKSLSTSYLELTKRDHIKSTYKHNAFHVNDAFTKAS